jgi:DtxR family Mn-dependent transcriptional regulator
MTHNNGCEYTPTRRERTYLPVIYYLTRRDPPVIAAQLARWLGVTPPTVTQAVQQLVSRDLICRDPRGAISLTGNGLALAEMMVRRHRILECFLVDVVGMPWHLVHEEAVHLEPVISPALEDRITVLVGAATTCPHGNPIPGCEEDLRQQIRLDRAVAGSDVILRRVAEEAEHNADLLRYLAEHLLRPGTRVRVVESSVAYGVTLHTGSQMLGLAPQVAGLLWGEHLTPDRPSPTH